MAVMQGLRYYRGPGAYKLEYADTFQPTLLPLPEASSPAPFPRPTTCLDDHRRINGQQLSNR